MGIPQLLQHLEKINKPKTKVYPDVVSSTTTTTSTATATATTGGIEDVYRPAAIIDGSALAHHIFNRNLKSVAKEERVTTVLGFDYEVYQRNVIRWLERLEVGFEITNILIDGHLPAYKTATRTARIQTTVANLSRLRTLSPSVIDLTKVNWNPSPPFLIAAFSAAVRQHERFGKVVRTVAGEADAFCSAAAAIDIATSGEGRDGGEGLSVVFTGDSDLVVYPSSPKCRVTMLDTVTFEASDNANKSEKVKVTLWSPWDIEQKLNPGVSKKGSTLTQVLKLAWCIVNKDMVKVAKAMNGDIKGDGLAGVTVGREFREQYLLPDVHSSKQGGMELLISAVEGILDSRAAEVVYASPSCRGLCHPPVLKFEDSGSREVEVYLPVLLEDITKSSVWSIGRGVRKVAYQMLFGANATVVEVHRKGEAVNRSSINLGETEDSDEVESLPLLPPKEGTGDGICPLLTSIILQIAQTYISKNLAFTDNDIIALLAAVSTTSSPAQRASLPPVTATHWTWPRAHLLSQLFAGIWSFYLLHTVVDLPDVEISARLNEGILTNLQHFKEFWKIIDPARFMAIYAILPPDRRGMTKNAKKRARKRAKLMEGQDTAGLGIVNRVFERGVREGVLGVLGAVGEMRRGEEESDHERGGGGGEGESYMGMEVG
ncbi:hypothetical protein TWF730_006987 [Orbilia blumenaviensis]|uniref:Asteroid domain-containing protein n=1 Tax=Orbilia blumenaviensis TaxID=1796055 RepID=A0AAV9VFX2_9PEZI